MRTLRNLSHSIPLHRQIPTRSVPTLSDPWLKAYPFFCTLVPQANTIKLLATQCYRHAHASRPIPFDSPGRADFHETLPDSGGHLPAEVSTIFTLLTSIAMRTVQAQYHLISLAEGNPTHPVRTLCSRCFKGYPYFCALVLQAYTFKLLATEC